MSATDSTMISTTFSGDNNSKPKTVRLFIDGNNQFVMTDELKLAIKGTPYNRDPNHKWYTMNGDIAKKMAEKSGHPIEFVPTPITRNQSIRTPLGERCLLAVECLLGVMEYLTFELQVLRAYNSENRRQKRKLTDFLAIMEEFLGVRTEKSQYFILMQKAAALRLLAADHFSGSPRRTALNAKSFAEQLIDLGILKTKSDILQTSSLIFIDHSDPRFNLYTCGLTCAIEKHPNFARFVHDQKACHCLLTCSICNAALEAKGMESEQGRMALVVKEVLSTKEAKDTFMEGLCAKVVDQSIFEKKKEEKKKNKKKRADKLRFSSKATQMTPEVASEEPQSLPDSDPDSEAHLTPEPRKIEEIPRDQFPIDKDQEELIDLRNKRTQLEAEDLLRNAAEKVNRLTSISKNDNVKEFAEEELDDFEVQYVNYSESLNARIEYVQNYLLNSLSNPNPPTPPPLSVYPTLTDAFFKALQKAEEDLKLDNECLICKDEMDHTEKEKLFKCPNCPSIVHLECIETWFKTSKSCPWCRMEWK